MDSTVSHQQGFLTQPELSKKTKKAPQKPEHRRKMVRNLRRGISKKDTPFMKLQRDLWTGKEGNIDIQRSQGSNMFFIVQSIPKHIGFEMKKWL